MERIPEDIFTTVAEILVEILDVDPKEVTPEAYLIRDLNVESIDLMELAVCLNERFCLEVDEELIFLKSLRAVIDKAQAQKKDTADVVLKNFPFLTSIRSNEMVATLKDGPVLKVKDLVQYIQSQNKQGSLHA
jgi:acyl carrier protein